MKQAIADPKTTNTVVPEVIALSGIELVAHDRADSLWSELIETWNSDQDALLVLGSRLDARRWMRQHSEPTVFGERVIALPDLWVRVAAQFSDLPQPLAPLETRLVLAEMLEDGEIPARLRNVRESKSGLDALASHLEVIEERADLSYEPQTDVERGIQRLRDKLIARDRTTGTGFRSLIARHAERAKLGEEGRRVLFAPSGQPTRYMAGLMKGLAEHHNVTVYALTTRPELPRLLADAGLDEVAVRDQMSAETFASRLFSGQPGGKPDIQLQWIEASDQIEAAIETLAQWIADGAKPSDTALVIRSSDDHAAKLEELASRRGVPLLIPARAAVRDSALGALLLQLASVDLREVEARDELLVGDVATYPLVAEDLEGILTARREGPLAELSALYVLGGELLDRVQPTAGERRVRGQETRAHAWLDGLGKTIWTFEKFGARPDSVVDALEETMSARQMRGQADGVTVVNYVGASGFQYRNAVLCSLSEDAYPLPAVRSPFVSAALERACPELRDPDRRPEFVAAVASASRRIAFVREAATPDGNEIAPSPFWQETLRAAGRLTDAEHTVERFSAENSPAPRRLLQRGAREHRFHTEIQRALAQATRERLPRGVLRGERKTFAVTELELFAFCPYGWFVKHVLRPITRQTPRARRGTIAHDVLSAAFRVPRPDRIELAHRKLRALGQTELTAVDLELLDRQISHVIDVYGGENWPFDTHLVEQSVGVDDLLEDLPGYRIQGRVDRLDLDDKRLLVIDYKARRSPKLKSPAERRGELQRYLYPQLAARQFAREALGTLYVSLFHGSHEGSLAVPLQGVDMRQVNTDAWGKEASQALQIATEAIQRIEAGEWDEEGRNCPAYCPHRLMSQTLRDVA